MPFEEKTRFWTARGKLFAAKQSKNPPRKSTAAIYSSGDVFSCYFALIRAATCHNSSNIPLSIRRAFSSGQWKHSDCSRNLRSVVVCKSVPGRVCLRMAPTNISSNDEYAFFSAGKGKERVHQRETRQPFYRSFAFAAVKVSAVNG